MSRDEEYYKQQRKAAGNVARRVGAMLIEEEAQRAEAARAQAIRAHNASPRAPFQVRGFSERTIDAIVNYGIDAPERLLFMTESQIRSIPEIGKVSAAEIAEYRAKFPR